MFVASSVLALPSALFVYFLLWASKALARAAPLTECEHDPPHQPMSHPSVSAAANHANHARTAMLTYCVSLINTALDVDSTVHANTKHAATVTFLLRACGVAALSDLRDVATTVISECSTPKPPVFYDTLQSNPIEHAHAIPPHEWTTWLSLPENSAIRVVDATTMQRYHPAARPDSPLSDRE